ncbi:hypothetical protein A2276_04165 [candidate division WOR-1 bacterium RIFOXYA12_FULL_43_27]|uniref:Cell shape-determining protein MreC n=1 Tax=candidate division WOR-1 bacterium RIFOXYC2_FULL_46_14 TaxID=1802587 RepID=A0A1F4U6W9_UNCSA|nr:MAG: hypothetical protein A2276_04165 [candidate division WOR-1 bacterium RIFOXYA12_FULL_43_27]OGC19115.1 MAG: hypothetical protein A2292_00170 [candidate division WOR-1 bacterium RIFOXYB2_FULL_46_45]OGC30103.1 MAG: hypothetical protein A2232_00170 [candidate division WOR-1 bacterium RIFOXYA2_FULL_46_56]OGC40705.1 MAG: hypothetical protein A2438_00175 [candidate division WOR-1 bacterium RIFOXYC2_FULL_46_14]
MYSKTVVILFLLAALALNFGGVAKSGVVSAFKSTIEIVAYPVEWLSFSGINSIGRFFSFVASVRGLAEENWKIKEENDFLKAELLRVEALAGENSAMRRAYSMRPRRAMREVILSQIISRPHDLWNSYLVIDCGKNLGIYPGATVLSFNGLVGRVIEVGRFSSKVRMIPDFKSTVSVRTAKSRIEALAVGDGSATVKLMYVPSGTRILIGEEVQVSASSDLLPGVMVGHIFKISGNERSLFREVEVLPSVNFSRLDFVYVVKE